MRKRTLGTFLAGWSFGFACVHVAWALEWRAGVPAAAAPIAQRPGFLAYDLVAAVLMYAAAAVALLLGRGALPPRARRALRTATVVGSALALARGLPALIWDAVAGGAGVGLAADIWFAVAGLAGLLLWWVRPSAALRGPAPG